MLAAVVFRFVARNDPLMIDTTTLEASLSKLARDLRESPAEFPKGRFAGRGIVIAAGGTTIFTNAYVLVSVLRNTLGCRLPIEVWHFGAAEMSPAMAHLLEDLQVKVIDAVPRIAAAGVNLRDGWQLKSFCLAHSGFAECLLLDADQVPVVDPTGVFGWPEYRETGAVFWPDIVAIRRASPVWDLMGLAPEQPEISFESGQILVDKRRHWRALSIAIGLNAAADLTYRLVYGDKDTFLLAWRLAGEPFSFIPHLPFRGDNCLFQRDFDGKTLFQHRTTGKWSYAADEQPTEGFRHFDACVAALTELRKRWNGRVFNPPDRSAAARQAEVDLIETGRFRLEIVGEENDEIELLQFGELGHGRSGFRQNWWCEEAGGSVELLLRDGDRITYRLARQDDGSWEGRHYLRNPRAVVLRPAGFGMQPAKDGAAGLADTLLRAIGYPHQSDEEWATHRPALVLVATSDPGVARQLRQIADSVEASTAGPLTELVDALEQQQVVTRIANDFGAVRRHYRSLIDDGNG